MVDLDSMSNDQLQAELDKAEAALQDLQEERQFTLGQTGVHIGASRVASLRAQWDREERALMERITAIRKLLQEGR